MGSHWVAKIAMMLACIVGFAVVRGIVRLFAGGGLAFCGRDAGVPGAVMLVSMRVFAILSAILGGCVGYKTIFIVYSRATNISN